MPTSNVWKNANHTIFIQVFKKFPSKIEIASKIFSVFFQPQIEFCKKKNKHLPKKF